MPTTVRVDERTKKGLDRLQGVVQAETGDRLSYSELLARLLRIAQRHEAELLVQGGPSWTPPSPTQLEALLRRVRDWGVKTDVTRVDEVLYGGSPHA